MIVYDSIAYADPAWLTSLAAAKITGQLGALHGGTGIDSSGATGVAQVAGGVWSVTTTLQNAVQDNITRLGAVTVGSFPAANLSGTTLAAGIVNSSLTSVGTIATGVWQGTAIGTAYTVAQVVSVTGTSNRISIGGTATNPTVDIAATYVGQASITTLGTIATGVWNGTAVSSTYGGTGLDSHLSTGIARVASGTWAVDATFATGATTGTGYTFSADGLTSGRTLLVSGSTVGSAGGEIVRVSGKLAPTNVGNPPGTRVLYSFADIRSTSMLASSTNGYFYTDVNNSTNAAEVFGLYSNITDTTALDNVLHGIDIDISASAGGAKTVYALSGTVAVQSGSATTVNGIFYNTIQSGAPTTGTQTTTGGVFAASSNNVNGATANVTGIDVTAEGTVASGTINAIGVRVRNGTMDTTGTSKQTGIQIDALSGADTNYALVTLGGNVGISTAAPTRTLDVTGTFAASGAATFGSTIWNTLAASASPFTQQRIIVYNDSANWSYFAYGTDAFMRVVFGNNANNTPLLFGTTTAYDNTGTFTEAARLTKAGDFTAIGTISAAGYKVNGAASSGTFLRGDGTNYVASTLTIPNTIASTLIPYASAANVLGSTNNFTFDGTNLGVGLGGAAASSPFHLKRGSSGSVGLFQSTGEAQLTIGSDVTSTLADLDILVRFTTGVGGTLKAFGGWDFGADKAFWGYNGAAVFGVDANGNVYINGSLPTTVPTGTKSLILGQGTILSSMIANTAGFSAVDVGGTAEAHAINEANEVVRLTGLLARNTAQFDAAATTTLANITGLSRNVDSGVAYRFEAILPISASAAGGCKFAMGGTATATSIWYWIVLEDEAWPDDTIRSRQTALGGSSGQVGTVSGVCRITGVIVVNAGGTLTAQFAQMVASGTSSVLANGSLKIERVS